MQVGVYAHVYMYMIVRDCTWSPQFHHHGQLRLSKPLKMHSKSNTWNIQKLCKWGLAQSFASSFCWTIYQAIYAELFATSGLNAAHAAMHAFFFQRTRWPNSVKRAARDHKTFVRQATSRTHWPIRGFGTQGKASTFSDLCCRFFSSTTWICMAVSCPTAVLLH